MSLGVGEGDTDIATRLATSRTHLANERTFAAWIRTGLSVATAGIAVAWASPRRNETAWASSSLSVTFIVLGSAMILFGGYRFGTVARDLDRAGSPPVRLARNGAYLMVSLLALLVMLTFVLFV